MRNQQYTLTAGAVQVHAEQLCQKHLRLRNHGPRCTAAALWAVLLFAAARVTSLAAACSSLRKAPCDSACHNALVQSLPEQPELTRRLNRALQDQLPRRLRRARLRIAIDLTLLPYHGEPLRSPKEIFRGKAKSGTTHFHAYATAHVVCKGQRYTVALLPVEKDQSM